MTKQLIHIAIFEPSHIIYEGLANILLRSTYHFQLYRFDNLEEFENSGLKYNLDLIIINPSLVQNILRNLAHLKRTNSHIIWSALVYSYFDRETLLMFDSTIQINESPETIINSIYKQVNITMQNTDTTISEQITERETDVLKLLVKGLSNKEIADKLNISIHTVISHRKNIIQKTGIKSQAGLTIYAISNKIVSIDSLSE